MLLMGEVVDKTPRPDKPRPETTVEVPLGFSFLSWKTRYASRPVAPEVCVRVFVASAWQ